MPRLGSRVRVSFSAQQERRLSVPLHLNSRFLISQCPGGGIGRRARFRCVCREACRFESCSGHYIAEIAQLVEHNLAKVRVASSSLVFRSKKKEVESFDSASFFLFTVYRCFKITVSVKYSQEFIFCLFNCI